MTPEKRAYNKAYYKANKPTFLTKAKLNYEANKPRVKSQAKNWKKINRDRYNAWARKNRKEWTAEQREGRSLVARRASLKKLYGLSLEQYDEMLANQNGVCALCYRSSKPRKWLDVDHNHSTGEVRGLLCMACNRSLGHFDKRIPRLLEYISGS